MRNAGSLIPAQRLKPARRKYSLPPPATGPITWHVGWEMMSWAIGEHPSQPTRQDQDHLGVEHRVILSTMPPVVMGDGSTNRQCLTASLDERTDRTEFRVLIRQNDGSGVAATFDEAKRFALSILALVDSTAR